VEASEREFFTKIKKAITSNPFSQERRDIDIELAGVSSIDSGPADEIFNKLLHKVSRRLENVNKTASLKRGGLNSGDSELLRYGTLFDLFHKSSGDFDQLIKQQISRGEDSCQVEFAKDVLKNLIDSGFSGSDSLRLFSLFYQMRRAFYFIKSIAGKSPCVQELRKSLWNNIFTHNIELYDSYLWNKMEDFSTMLLGETGTGKGLAASAIGRSGFIPFDEKRSCFQESFAKTFVSINLSQFSEQLIESELFGHKKGAFTGAIEAHKGIFSHCSPFGAIFIDEIGDVSIPVQIKLLQVLQERKFSPVGSHTSEKFQGRVIAATNQPLSTMRKEGKFREDFYYRLCSDVIEVPTLRRRLKENPDELGIILEFILERIVGRSPNDLVEQVGTFIINNQPKNYSWPGNIRELEQCARRFLLNKTYKWQHIGDDETNSLTEGIEQGTLTAHQLLTTYCSWLYQKLGTYGAVAKITELDRRTVKKYIHYDPE
jgi:hypothetical protein